MSLRAYLASTPWNTCRCDGGERPLCPAEWLCAGRLDFDARRDTLARVEAALGVDPRCVCGHADEWHPSGGICGHEDCLCGRYEGRDSCP